MLVTIFFSLQRTQIWPLKHADKKTDGFLSIHSKLGGYQVICVFCVSQLEDNKLIERLFFFFSFF